MNRMIILPILLCSQSVGADSSASDPGLKVATCQFSVSGDVDENARHIKDFVKEAATNQADIVHFSEAALSGYARVDVPNFDDYDWDKLRTHTKEIMGLAKEHGILYRTFPDKKITEEFPSWTRNNKAMVLPADEVYHNGTPSTHPRATNRRALP